MTSKAVIKPSNTTLKSVVAQNSTSLFTWLFFRFSGGTLRVYASMRTWSQAAKHLNAPIIVQTRWNLLDGVRHDTFSAEWINAYLALIERHDDAAETRWCTSTTQFLERSQNRPLDLVKWTFHVKNRLWQQSNPRLPLRRGRWNSEPIRSKLPQHAPVSRAHSSATR